LVIPSKRIILAIGSAKINALRQKAEKSESSNRKEIQKEILQYEAVLPIITTLEKSLYRALNELQRLQAQHHGQPVMPPIMLDVNISEDGGFVSQKSD
jgi:hypothetical protein